jgi:DNA-binding PadR family transcriptional regulator
MTELALELVEKQLPVDQKAMAYSDIIRALPPIKTVNEYIYIGELWKDGKAILKEIDEGYDDLIKAAHKLHKDAVAKKAKYYAPAELGVRDAKQLMSTWDAEQERIRLAEQRRLKEIARKEEEAARKAELNRLEVVRKAEEDRLIAAATAAEAAGDRQRAEDITAAAIAMTQEAKQEAAAIQAEPVYIPPVILPKETPKVQGMSFRTIWKYRIDNESLIPRQYLIPDEKKIGAVIRANQGKISIPGVTPYEERC